MGSLYIILGAISLLCISNLISFLIGRSLGKKSVELTDDSTVLKEQTTLAQTYATNADLAALNRRHLSESSPGPVSTGGETGVSPSLDNKVPIKDSH